MRLGGIASHLCEIVTESDLLEALAYAKEHQLATHIVGEGSNSIFGAKGFRGLIIVNKILGVSESGNSEQMKLTIGSGENWDDIVSLTVEKGFSDIAALSLIPGTTGAAPVQNIGAYGQQISNSIISVRAYDCERADFVTLQKNECAFSYRHSRFNTTDKARFIITSVKMRLSRKTVSPPFYADVTAYFKEHGNNNSEITPSLLREAVSIVRVVKLPDPRDVASSGSFFKNPVVAEEVYQKLKDEFPELKVHKTDDGSSKLYGAQLIELCGLKNFHDAATGMATWKNQALVLINESAKTSDDLFKFKETIIQKVKDTFGITLIQEPEFIELV